MNKLLLIEIISIEENILKFTTILGKDNFWSLIFLFKVISKCTFCFQYTWMMKVKLGCILDQTHLFVSASTKFRAWYQDIYLLKVNFVDHFVYHTEIYWIDCTELSSEESKLVYSAESEKKQVFCFIGNKQIYKRKKTIFKWQIWSQ